MCVNKSVIMWSNMKLISTLRASPAVRNRFLQYYMHIFTLFRLLRDQLWCVWECLVLFWKALELKFSDINFFGWFLCSGVIFSLMVTSEIDESSVYLTWLYRWLDTTGLPFPLCYSRVGIAWQAEFFCTIQR